MLAPLIAVQSWIRDTLAAAQKSPRTIENYEYVTGRFWKYLQAEHLPIDLDEIKPAHVRSFYATAKVKKSSLLSWDRALRAVFSRIEREGKDDFALSADWHSPLAKVAPVHVKHPQKRPLTEVDAKALLAAQSRRGFINLRNYTELAMLLLTGLRASELIAVCLADLDLNARIVRVLHGKGDKARTVFLSTKLTRILSAYLAKRGDRGQYLFPTRDGKQQTRRAVHRTVSTAGRRAGLRLHPHLLRHTYISIALNVKHAPMRYIQDQVGHEDVRTTMGYNHVPEGEARKLADEFSVL